jgi:hypothetical protein
MLTFGMLRPRGISLSILTVTRPRSAGRQTIAAVFWLHALYAASFLHLPLLRTIQLPNCLDTLILALIIAFYSYFAEYEWLSILADCIYVYLWPCIIVVKLSWLSIKFIYKWMKSNLVVHSPGLITRPIQASVPSLTAAQEPEKPKEANPAARSVAAWVRKPFTEFSLLWSLMILTTGNRFIIIIATSVAVYCAGRAIYELWDFTSDASSWIEKLKGTFASQIATHVGQVRAWEEMTQIDEVTKAANALKMLESIFMFIADNKRFLTKVTVGLSIVVSLIFYCYISFVFSCAYVGMAKIQSLPTNWPDFFVTSLFIPIAFTNLPRNVPIELIGGLQAVAVLALGWNIFVRHMNSGFRRVALAASELRGPFEDRVLKVKYALIEEQAAKLGPVAPLAASRTDVPKTEPTAPATTPDVGRKGFRQAKKKGKNR